MNTKNEVVFSVPGRGIIDFAITRNGILVSQIEGETLEQMALRYPGVIQSTYEEANAEKIASFISGPVEISEEKFNDMLECLPPVDWERRMNAESFKMMEMTYGNITGIYARVENRYFYLSNVVTMKHVDIIAMINKAFPAQ